MNIKKNLPRRAQKILVLLYNKKVMENPENLFFHYVCTLKLLKYFDEYTGMNLMCI